jgi:hypothetical protein
LTTEKPVISPQNEAPTCLAFKDEKFEQEKSFETFGVLTGGT